MRKLSSIITLFALMMVAMSGTAMSTPTVDGVFDTTEWAGYYADDDGVGSGGFVDPGYGGQAYDVEYLGLYFDSSTVYFGLQAGYDVTGITPTWGPGDFALDVDGDLIYDYAIDYVINSDGSVTYYLVDMTSIDGDTYWQDVHYPQYGISNPYQAVYTYNGQGATNDDVIYEWTVMSAYGYDGTSYVLEGSFDLSYLTAYVGGDMTDHWTMECGNDYLNQTSSPVPEPATMFLLGTGLIGLAGFTRKKIFKK